METLQPDPSAAVAFYGGLFGWVFVGPGRMPGRPPGQYFVARLRGRDVAGVGSLPSDGVPEARAWNTYVRVASAEEAAERARRAGGAVVVEPFDGAAGRMTVLADQAGATFCAWEPGDRKGARIVNEPGAWATSVLSTRDLDGSAAFYGEVFGWTTEKFGVGASAMTLFRLPGYVG